MFEIEDLGGTSEQYFETEGKQAALFDLYPQNNGAAQVLFELEDYPACGDSSRLRVAIRFADSFCIELIPYEEAEDSVCFELKAGGDMEIVAMQEVFASLAKAFERFIGEYKIIY